MRCAGNGNAISNIIFADGGIVDEEDCTFPLAEVQNLLRRLRRRAQESTIKDCRGIVSKTDEVTSVAKRSLNIVKAPPILKTKPRNGTTVAETRGKMKKSTEVSCSWDSGGGIGGVGTYGGGGGTGGGGTGSFATTRPATHAASSTALVSPTYGPTYSAGPTTQTPLSPNVTSRSRLASINAFQRHFSFWRQNLTRSRLVLLRCHARHLKAKSSVENLTEVSPRMDEDVVSWVQVVRDSTDDWETEREQYMETKRCIWSKLREVTGSSGAPLQKSPPVGVSFSNVLEYPAGVGSRDGRRGRRARLRGRGKRNAKLKGQAAKDASSSKRKGANSSRGQRRRCTAFETTSRVRARVGAKPGGYSPWTSSPHSQQALSAREVRERRQALLARYTIRLRPAARRWTPRPMYESQRFPLRNSSRAAAAQASSAPVIPPPPPPVHTPARVSAHGPSSELLIANSVLSGMTALPAVMGPPVLPGPMALMQAGDAGPKGPPGAWNTMFSLMPRRHVSPVKLAVPPLSSVY